MIYAANSCAWLNAGAARLFEKCGRLDSPKTSGYFKSAYRSSRNVRLIALFRAASPPSGSKLPRHKRMRETDPRERQSVTQVGYIMSCRGPHDGDVQKRDIFS